MDLRGIMVSEKCPSQKVIYWRIPFLHHFFNIKVNRTGEEISDCQWEGMVRESSRGWERTTKVQKEGVPWCHHSPDLDRGGGYRKLHMYYLLYMHIKKVLTNLGGPNKRCALYQCLFPSF